MGARYSCAGALAKPSLDEEAKHREGAEVGERERRVSAGDDECHGAYSALVARSAAE
jgi:hypothetical protein